VPVLRRRRPARGNNPYCHHRAIELLGRGRRERLRHVARAPGAPFDHGLFELIEEDWPTEERARAEQVLATGEGWITDSPWATDTAHGQSTG
jgi:hypothetical protein